MEYAKTAKQTAKSNNAVCVNNKMVADFGYIKRMISDNAASINDMHNLFITPESVCEKLIEAMTAELNRDNSIAFKDYTYISFWINNFYCVCDTKNLIHAVYDNNSGKMKYTTIQPIAARFTMYEENRQNSIFSMVHNENVFKNAYSFPILQIDI